ncbi:Teichoic acids export ATP-binding protein TagH [Dissostichus eleginoides]|uniref:Teichoic acids export ATP-binding protein TagH n=1 Tax=Dissostichus eleginoides TaxID=100907 RepID=A0AAD9CDH8_DISEL|nr:Teichoic acids export ATP-binding protein TagH [Dissostichus eleginoides]
MTSYKKSSFFALGPVSSALMCSTATATTGDKPGPTAKGAFSSEGDKDKQNEVSQSRSQQGASVCPSVEEFFWKCGSIVAFSKWRIGYMGKLCQRHCTEFSRIDIKRYKPFVDIFNKASIFFFK